MTWPRPAHGAATMRRRSGAPGHFGHWLREDSQDRVRTLDLRIYNLRKIIFFWCCRFPGKKAAEESAALKYSCVAATRAGVSGERECRLLV
jgi:hypothetical protein